MLNTCQYEFTGTHYMIGIQTVCTSCRPFVLFFLFSEWPRDEAGEECTGRHKNKFVSTS